MIRQGYVISSDGVNYFFLDSILRDHHEPLNQVGKSWFNGVSCNDLRHVKEEIVSKDSFIPILSGYGAFFRS
jgi:hypothetical protein